jgi:hypothetical protein
MERIVRRESQQQIAENDLIQVNEDGPANWFRCILVVDEVKPWGVQAYAIIPQSRDKPSADAFMRLSWNEFETLGVKSKFIAGDKATEEESI